MFLSRNKKTNVYYIYYILYYYIKVGFKGVKLIKAGFRIGTFASSLDKAQPGFPYWYVCIFP